MIRSPQKQWACLLTGRGASGETAATMVSAETVLVFFARGGAAPRSFEGRDRGYGSLRSLAAPAAMGCPAAAILAAPLPRDLAPSPRERPLALSCFRCVAALATRSGAQRAEKWSGGHPQFAAAARPSGRHGARKVAGAPGNSKALARGDARAPRSTGRRRAAPKGRTYCPHVQHHDTNEERVRLGVRRFRCARGALSAKRRRVTGVGLLRGRDQCLHAGPGRLRGLL